MGEQAQLRIEYEALSAIKQAPRNPKDHDLGALSESMERFGYTLPMTVNETTGRLVAGHGRLDALRQRKAAGLPPPRRVREKDGDWLVPVMRGVGFDTDQEAEAYLLADNRMGELGGWDDAQLAEVLADLAAEDNLDGIGWDTEDVDSLLAQVGDYDIASVNAPPSQSMSPAEKLQQQYLTTGVRQIQLVMDEAEYEEVLGILEKIIEQEQVDTNTDAVLLLLRRWDTAQGA